MRYLALLSVLCLVPPASSRNSADVTESAERAADCDDWDLSSYDWVSSDRVFFLRATEPEYAGCFRRRGYDRDQLARGFTARTQGQLVAYKLSPDRKWALIDEREDPEHPALRAVSLDGTTEKRVLLADVDPKADFAWMPDGNGFVLLSESEGGLFLTHYALYGSQTPDHVKIQVPEGCSRNAGRRLLAGVTPAGRAVLRSAPRQRGDTVEIIEADVDGRQPARVFEVAAAEDEFALEVVLSSKGDRLAWIIAMGDTPAKARAEIRVSRLDGSDMRTLGAVEREVDIDNPAHLRWLPAGDQVSFVHRRALYVVPIPAERHRPTAGAKG